MDGCSRAFLRKNMLCCLVFLKDPHLFLKNLVNVPDNHPMGLASLDPVPAANGLRDTRSMGDHVAQTD